jgi:3D (Asp-Asp-Asp) domain-containing protein
MNQKIFILMVIMVGAFVFSANTTHAQQVITAERVVIDVESIPVSHKTFWQTLMSYLGLKSNNKPSIPIGTTLHVTSSAYSPSKYQTDGSPCVTAAGTTVRPGVVATNFLPMGTILSIEDKKYIVEDRMNSRYKGYYMDIWFPSTSQALEFGRRKLDITILDYGKPGDVIVTPNPAPQDVEVKKSIWSTLADTATVIGQFLTTKADLNRYDISCSQ